MSDQYACRICNKIISKEEGFGTDVRFGQPSNPLCNKCRPACIMPEYYAHAWPCPVDPGICFCPSCCYNFMSFSTYKAEYHIGPN